MRFSIFTIILLLCFSVNTSYSAAGVRADEEDYDESIRMPIRRLHPERRQAQQEQEEKKANKKTEKKKATTVQKTVSKSSAKSPADVWGSGEDKQGQTSTSDKDLMNQLLSRDYTITDYSAEALRPMKWKDEPVNSTRDELLPHFGKKIMKTGNSPQVRYLPVNVTMRNTENEIYFYFDAKDNHAEELHLRAQYYADDPLAFSSIKFTINGFDYDFNPRGTNTGKGKGRMIWENCDRVLDSGDKDLIYALTHGAWVRVTFIGERGMNHVRMLTDEQIAYFRYAFELYRLMGGKLNESKF